MKKILLSITVATLFLGACRKPDEVVPNTKNEVADIFATKDGFGKERLFEPRFSANKDTIYFDIPYFYPADSDTETDLAKIIIRSTIPSDARVTPSLGNLMDVSKPFNLTVTSGDGQVRTYVVVCKKVGDLSVKSAKLKLSATEEIDAIINGNDIVFFVVPGTDISTAKLHYAINKHSSASIANESPINLSQNQSFRVTGIDGVVKTYTLKALEPVKLPYGVGINRRIWAKSSLDLGQSGNLDVSMALSGDHIAVVIRSNPAVYRVYNRFTGAYVQNMVNPIVGNSFMIANDSIGNLLTSSYAPRNAKFLVYKYTNALDASPVKLIDWTNTTSTTVSASDGGVGRRVHVYGNLNANAVILATIGNSKAIYRWRVANGALVNNDPELLEIPEVLGVAGHMGFYSEAQPVSGDAKANYFVNYSGDVALINGETQQKIAGFSQEPSVVGTFHTGMAYARFNNANFLAIVKYIGATTRARLGLFDVTETAKLSLPFADPRYSTFSMYESEDRTSGTNPNGTADICIGFSPDKERMQVYMLVTGGGIMAQEFTKYAR